MGKKTPIDRHIPDMLVCTGSNQVEPTPYNIYTPALYKTHTPHINTNCDTKIRCVNLTVSNQTMGIISRAKHQNC